MRSLAALALPPMMLLSLAACGSNIDVPDTSGSGGGGGSGGSGGVTSGGTISGGQVGSGSPSGTGSASNGATSGGNGATTSGGNGATSGGTTAGSGTATTGASSGSGGGSPPSELCGECVEQAVAGPCVGVMDACLDDFACTQLLDCHGDCEWTPECNAQCDAIIPSGVAKLKALLDCAACDNCGFPCQGSVLMNYCQ